MTIQVLPDILKRRIKLTSRACRIDPDPGAAIGARCLGRQIIADLHIEVDPGLTVQESHVIASEVEMAISTALGNVYDVTVHVEPTRVERSQIE